jgi:hypothetical protein
MEGDDKDYDSLKRDEYRLQESERRNVVFRQALQVQLVEHGAVHNPAELAAWLGESGPEDARQKLLQNQMTSLGKKDELLAWVANWVFLKRGGFRHALQRFGLTREFAPSPYLQMIQTFCRAPVRCRWRIFVFGVKSF